MIHESLHAYIQTCIRTYTYISTYIDRFYMHTYVHTYIVHTYLDTIDMFQVKCIFRVLFLEGCKTGIFVRGLRCTFAGVSLYIVGLYFDKTFAVNCF